MARVHLAVWRATYGHLLSEDLMVSQERRLDERVAMWERAVDGDGTPLVAVLDGEVVGLAAAHDHSIRPGPVHRPADASRPCGLELQILNLLAAHHGSGLGQALLDAAIGDQPCFLWVAEDNPRAQSFYSRNHFRPDGERFIETEWDDLAEVRLVRGMG